MQNSQQDQSRNIKVNKMLVDLVTPRVKEYQKLMNSVQKVMTTANDAERFGHLINFQDTEGKTLIHHIIENPRGGYRDGLWTVIELHIKGASLNIQDKLGNTALHTCANLYRDVMSKQTIKNSTEAYFTLDLHESNLGSKRLMDDLIISASMGDVGAMLLCGANPTIKNNKQETVWDILNATASKMQQTSTKPKIDEASCKSTFIVYFENRKHGFAPNPHLDNITMYPWAPNVVNWAEKQKATLAKPEPNNCVLF